LYCSVIKRSDKCQNRRHQITFNRTTFSVLVWPSPEGLGPEIIRPFHMEVACVRNWTQLFVRWTGNWRKPFHSTLYSYFAVIRPESRSLVQGRNPAF
jgi:hypothetical protein